MREYALEFERGFVDPRVWQDLAGTSYDVEVSDTGRVDVAGHSFSFRDDDHPGPGTTVRVLRGRNVTCAALDDVLVEKRAMLANLERLNDIREAQDRRDEALARAMNATLGIPVAWDTDIKRVYSGLLEHSRCNGTYRSTVVHVRLKGDLRAGRLVRGKGDLLCTANAKDRGRFSDLDGYVRHAGADGDYPPLVTCKACLALARRRLW